MGKPYANVFSVSPDIALVMTLEYFIEAGCVFERDLRKKAFDELVNPWLATFKLNWEIVVIDMNTLLEVEAQWFAPTTCKPATADATAIVLQMS